MNESASDGAVMALNAEPAQEVAGSSIRLDRVSKSFGDFHAAGPVDLNVQPGEFVSIIGPSGCGKSTLLRLADGLLEPDAGQIEIGGSAPQPGPTTGMVFQNFRLIPWRSVAGNVGFALEGMDLTRTALQQRVETQLEQVGLAEWADHYPAQLSGGMRQRVALARALIGRPGVLLMDEPFASLDAQTRELMQADLLALWERQRPTVLFVTHSVDEALLLADRVIVMGGGTVLEDLPIDLPRPRRSTDARRAAEYGLLREHLWSRIRELVLADPASAFFGRQGDRRR
mgnify:CR=1 FL=1